MRPEGAAIIRKMEGKPPGLLGIKDKYGRERIIVPKSQRIRLISQEHQTLLHVGGPRVRYSLVQKYCWPKMRDLIHDVCAACPDCQRAKARREKLSAEFKTAEEQQLSLPRQQHGIDFYGRADGQILVAIDLCTREVLLWFLKDRKQDAVAKALLSGLIFQKGVPMVLRNDEASEFAGGAAAAMNEYLGIDQITTGGYNPRSNAVAERFMSTLGHMLRVCSDQEYKGIKDYLQCISFAHNCTFNSAIEATPFEIGHGFPARTVSDARMSLPKLRLTTEEGMPVKIMDKREKGLHKKALELSIRLAKVAQMHSEWHRKMTAQKLNQSGKKIEDKLLEVGSKVFFYRPPSQGETLRLNRKKKRLFRYRGPATAIIRLRDRQYAIEYTVNGRTRQFKRDASMLIPAADMPALLSSEYEPAEASQEEKTAAARVSKTAPTEGEIVILKDDPSSEDWYVAEVYKVLPEAITVRYFSAYTPSLDNYVNADPTARAERLSQVRFRRTWFIRSGANRGRATLKPPYPNNPDLRAWEGTIPSGELDGCLMARNLRLSPEGQLDDEALKLVAVLPIPRAVTIAAEDEQGIEDAEASNAPPLFLYSEERLCACSLCQTRLCKTESLATCAPANL